MTGLARWLAERAPAPPDALRLPRIDGAGDPVEMLTDEGVRLLDRALTGAGERKGAFDLLAADALLTYACEAAARCADPEAALLGILRRIG